MLSQISEAERLHATRELGLFDTPSEQQFDDLVELASSICGVPVALMTLLDSDRQYHKSHIGIDVLEVPRSLAFCDYTIRQDDVMVVEDATLDDRFSKNPFVVGAPNIRFYAGAPLSTPDGAHIGALCVIDMQPHTLSAEQRRSMQTIAHQIELRMELRRREIAAEKTMRELALSRDSFRSFADAIPIEAYLKDSAGRILFYNRRVAERFNITSDQWLGKTSYDLWPLHVADQIALQEAHVLRTRRASESYIETPEPDGTVTYWKSIKIAIEQTSGEVMVGSVSIDLTEDLQRESRLQEMQDALERANRKLQTLSMTDELTGLWNRRAFDQRLAEEIIGIAVLQPNETAEQFTHRADLALYAAKRSGKDRATFHHSDMQ